MFHLAENRKFCVYSKELFGAMYIIYDSQNKQLSIPSKPLGVRGGPVKPLREIGVRGKDGRCIGLPTFPTSCSDCLVILGALIARPCLYWDCSVFTFIKYIKGLIFVKENACLLEVGNEF